MNKYIILGNGVAGVSAARKIRELDPQGHIDIVTRESHAFYSRPMLPRLIGGDVREEDIVIYGPDWYKKNDVSLSLNEEITDIEKEKGEARSASGHGYHFDRLLMGTGSYCFVPPIKGVETPGVFTLRSLNDARQIKDHARKSQTAIIIGAGVLGLEVAAALTKYGIRVSLIESAPRMLPRQLDPAGAGVLQKQLQDKMGFTFYLDSQVQEVSGNGQARGVLLAGGEKVPGDLILVSAGVRPNTALARHVGLKVNRGVVVDNRMETSAKGIFAAGDVAEHGGVVYGILTAAQKQGEVAGVNMAGGNETYQGTTQSNAVSVLGISLVSTGEIDPEGRFPSLIRKDEVRHVYRKLVLKDDYLVGCILLNDIRGSFEILQAIEKKRNVGPVKDVMLEDNFDYKRIL